MTIKACDAGWASVIGLICAIATCTVFAVALVVALLLEFVVTGHICEIVDQSSVTIGGRICGATSLLAFVVGFGVVAWRVGKAQARLTTGRGEEPVRPWRRE